MKLRWRCHGLDKDWRHLHSQHSSLLSPLNEVKIGGAEGGLLFRNSCPLLPPCGLLFVLQLTSLSCWLLIKDQYFLYCRIDLGRGYCYHLYQPQWALYCTPTDVNEIVVVVVDIRLSGSLLLCCWLKSRPFWAYRGKACQNKRYLDTSWSAF